MVLGEPQILGQLKDAYRAAHETGTTGPSEPAVADGVLGRQARAHRDADRRQRRVGRIGSGCAWRATVFASFENRTALLVGAGETIALAARHLHATACAA